MFATVFEEPFPLPHYCGGIDFSAVDKSVLLTPLFSKIIYSAAAAAALTSDSDVTGPLVDVHPTIYEMSTIF